MRPGIPELTKVPRRTVLTVRSVGDPAKVTQGVMQALYGTAFGTKFKVYKPRGREMTVGPASAFWFDAHRKPRAKWTAQWLLEVPAFVRQRDLVQKVPTNPATVTKLPAGTAAQILHVGTYAAETSNIQKLHAFIAAQGYAIAGPHEEIYLTKPGPKARTIIRYRVTKGTNK